MKRAVRIVAAAVIVVACVAAVVLSQTEQAPQAPAPPPIRAIPGLNAPDPHPNGCVDCHLNYKEFKLDTRFTTLMGKLTQGEVDPRVLAAAKAAAPDSTKITGKHPKTSAAQGEIPRTCLVCHGRSSKFAPPFARMLHLIHLTGGETNHYLSQFQGDCTHCHKLNQQTGTWTIPSAKEPPGD